MKYSFIYLLGSQSFINNKKLNILCMQDTLMLNKSVKNRQSPYFYGNYFEINTYTNEQQCIKW